MANHDIHCENDDEPLGLAMCTQESLCMPGWGFSNIMFAYKAVGAMIGQADLHVPIYIHVYSVVGINCQLLLYTWQVAFMVKLCLLIWSCQLFGDPSGRHQRT
jgi:hypothetical protein